MEQKQYPKVVVGTVIYNDKNEILIAKSAKWGGKWVIPGGHLEWGESLQNCVRREIKEETNLDVENPEFMQLQESILPKQYHKPAHMIFLDHCCKAKTNNVILNEELQEHLWISPEKALTMDLLGFTGNTISRFISFKKL